MRCALIAGLVALGGAAQTASAGRVTVDDPLHHFSLTIPDDYREQPPNPKLLRSWQRGEPGAAGFVQFQLIALGGTLPRGPIDRVRLEEAAGQTALAGGAVILDFSYEKVKWRDFFLDLVIAHAKKSGVKVVTLGAQVPLARDAVQLQCIGLTTDEKLIRDELTSIIDSLQGQPSWLTDSERDTRIGAAVGCLFALVVIGGTFWRRLRVRRRRAR